MEVYKKSKMTATGGGIAEMYSVPSDDADEEK